MLPWAHLGLNIQGYGLTFGVDRRCYLPYVSMVFIHFGYVRRTVCENNYMYVIYKDLTPSYLPE